jgi:hypothetical protein
MPEEASASARPAIIIPPALKPLAAQKRWTVWKWDKGKDGKLTKPPFRADAPNRLASSTDPSTWCDLKIAMLAYCEGRYDGIGFVLTDSEVGAFDLDHCRDVKTGNLHPWALDKINRSRSYAEVTPSDKGVRIIGLAGGAPVHRKFNVPNANGMSCELYRKANRYITITGNQIGVAAEMVNIDTLLDETLADLDGENPSTNGAGQSPRREHNLDSLIKDGCGEDFGGDRSKAVWYLVHQLLGQGSSADDVVAVLTNPNLGISAHVLDQPHPEKYARKQVEKAQKERAADPGRKHSRPKAADILIELSARAEELFHAPDGTGFATIPVDDHLETWPIRSKVFRRWLAREFFTKTSSAPNSDAIQSALNVIEARAHFDGAQRLVYVRVGAHDGRIYLDLADEKWRAVEISSTGWQIVDRPPVRFRRAAGMLPLPEPVRGGKIEGLRSFLNVKDGDDGKKDFVLTVSFTLAALRERGPYPVFDLIGEHGSAKSTFARVLRKLIDPNSAPLRALPREDRDLFIAANNGHLLVFDNVSKMPDWISDTLCRLATGGGFAARQLYSDQDEALFDAMRPIVLNGIEDIIGRPDLADRAIFLALKNISDEKRRPEKKFWEDFDAAHPCILGALLDGVAHGLRKLPNIRLKRIPRMADFATWATACETAYWQAGTFAQAYEQNRDDAIDTVIEADLVATAMQSFMAKRTEWQGTSTDLLGALKMAVAEDLTKLKEWPSSPRSLSGRLRRAAATLRKIGTDITFDRDSYHSRNRIIRIARKEGDKDRPNRPNRPNPEIINDLGPDGRSDGTDGEAHVTVRPNTPKNKASDGVDGSDAKIPTHTGKDENGGEPALSTRWPALSPRAVDQLAREFWGLKTGSAAELEDAIRSRLAKSGVPGEAHDVEVEKVVRHIEALDDAVAGSKADDDGIPFMITLEMKDQLRSRGFTDNDVFHMRPQQARDILADPNRNANSERSDGDEPRPGPSQQSCPPRQ